MNKYFTKDFFRFTFGFLTIIAVSFGILLLTNYLYESGAFDGSDNSAEMNGGEIRIE